MTTSVAAFNSTTTGVDVVGFAVDGTTFLAGAFLAGAFLVVGFFFGLCEFVINAILTTLKRPLG